MRTLVLPLFLALALACMLFAPPSQAASRTQCINQYCPSCAGSITLLGQSASQDCERCKSRRASQIDRCASGSSSATRNHHRCYVGYNNSTRRYAVACDGNDGNGPYKLTRAGYTSIVKGPLSYQQCWSYANARRGRNNSGSGNTRVSRRCYVGFNNSTRRYAVACDGNDGNGPHKLARAGYTSIVKGPATYQQCWSYANARRGRNNSGSGNTRVSRRCYVGFNNSTRRYAVACDGNDGSGPHKLARAGYTSIVRGPTTYQLCWNYINAHRNRQGGGSGNTHVSRRCFAGFDNRSHRYAVACDGNDGSGPHKLARAGYTSIVKGPATYQQCWNYINTRRGRNNSGSGRCFVGFNNSTRRYAVACDGNDGSGPHKLTRAGYTSIVRGPATYQQCWNYARQRQSPSNNRRPIP